MGNGGKDALFGGSGDDIFKLAEGDDHTLIRDFTKGEDKIDVRGFDNIEIVGSGNHAKIYQDDDLLAIVFNENDFSTSNNGFLI